MKVSVSALLALLTPLVIAGKQNSHGNIHDDHENSLHVKTQGGTVIGLINGTTPHVRQWLNIPYAQPPLGDLRWAAPRALNDSNKVVDATQYGLACPQLPPTSRTLSSTYVPQLLFNASTGEDCLNLAVWAPSNSTGQKLPVFIFLFGGGYTTGGIETQYQIPAQWVERTKEHIVISVNTRTNIFGYPGAAGLADESQNFGILDQRAAIEWARDNIAAFGGDPEHIVVWGQSSGGGSVDLLNHAYYDDPIVAGFISDSGSVFLNNQKNDPLYSNFSAVAEHFNCSTADPKVEINCLRNISSADIISYMAAYSAAGETPALKFVPFVDNHTVFQNWTERYHEGKVSDRPAIFGNNYREGYFVATFPENPFNTSANSTVADYYTLHAFLCPAAYSAQLRDSLNLTTYRYQYRGNFSNISPFPWLGAYHGSELPLIFGTYGDWRGAPSAFETALSEDLQDLWLAFAKDPQNGVVQGDWESYNAGYVGVFGGNNTQGQDVAIQSLPIEEIDYLCTPDIYADIIGGDSPFASF